MGTGDNLFSTALPAVGTRPGYIASAAHYEAVARRIIAALRRGPIVLVTGDPPADLHVLREALGNVAGLSTTVIAIYCGPELTRDEVDRYRVSVSTTRLRRFPSTYR